MRDVVRVVLADDHALVLEGLRSLLGGQKGIRVVALPLMVNACSTP